MVEAKAIETLVDIFFSQSHDFNGLPLTSVLKIYPGVEAMKEVLADSIKSGRLSCAFASVSGNPHIKRLRDLSIEHQIEILSAEPDLGVCIYPTEKLVRERRNVDQYNDRPFTKKLALASAQLDWYGFDLGVLERYRDDPRYIFEFYDHSGRLSISDTEGTAYEVPERDKVFLQSFGVGYSEGGRRLAVVFLRYLSKLSPEHQQYWNSFRHNGEVKLHPEYYRSSYLGEFPIFTSYIGAILKEMELLNELTTGIYGRCLFREIYSEERRPSGFTPFFRPTLKNFNEFILAMDKLLSENLSQDFFRGKIALEIERTREDGKIVVERRSSIALLEKWLREEIQWHDEDEAISAIVGPFRKVRRKRQAPAHKLQENEYSDEYDAEQHEIFKEVYLGLMHLRRMLATHQNAPRIDVPNYLTEGRIAFS